MKSAYGLILSAAFLMGSDIRSIQPEGLTVHEWGTFTSVADADGSAVEWDTLGCTSDLPGFVKDQGYRKWKARLRGTVRMETPVIYFYSPAELTANVKVQFPHGAITEWYPTASSGTTPNPDGFDLSARNMNSTIEWRNVRVQPGAHPSFPVEHEPNPYYAARATDAALLTVGDEHEKFLFYRGVATFDIPLTAAVDANGNVLAMNKGTAPIPGVILFENHAGRMGYRAAGTLNGALRIQTPQLESSTAKLRQQLETELIAQGLYPREAHAMLETWHDSWFEEGSRLIYIVPARTVNNLLPLQIAPEPKQTVRVFVGRMELVSPETRHSVATAVAKDDWAAVRPYGRFLDPILKRLYPQDNEKSFEIERKVNACR